MDTSKKSAAYLQEKYLVYFRLVDPLNKRYKCLIDDCKKGYLAGKKKHNIVSHAKKQHSKFFVQHFGADEIQKKNYPLPYRRLKYIQYCVEIVAVNGNSFAKLNESGIAGLMRDELEALRIQGFGSGLGPPHYTAVKKHIAYLSGEIRNQIKTEVQYKDVAAMADTATKHNLSILGLSIQYLLKGQHTIRTIGMMNLTEPQTARNLKDAITHRLQAYQVDEDQIISFTTDNANSMTAMIRLLNDDQMSIVDSIDEDDSDEDTDEEEEQQENNDDDSDRNPFFAMDACNSNRFGSESNENDYDTDDEDRTNEIDNILNENEELDDLSSELKQQFSANTMNISGIRCAAHTIQLAVQDALANKNVKELLKKCKKVCILLRKKGTKFILRNSGIQIIQPRLESRTRWNSKYRMLKDLLRCSSAIDCLATLLHDEDVNEVQRKWTTIEEIVNVLSVPYAVTTTVDSSELTLSDMYGALLKMEMKLKRIVDQNQRTDLAATLMETFSVRRIKLTELPVMKCAIYLDPRYHFELSDCDIKIAKYTLEVLHAKWKRRIEQSETATDSNDDSFEKCLKAKRKRGTAETNENENLALLLEKFEQNLPNMHHRESILNYWESRKDDEPVLYQLACMINTIAPTQVTVERAFSILGLVFNCRRTSLSPELLEHLLIIKLNREMVPSINMRDLERLIN